MPGLDRVLVVLEDNFHKVMKFSSNHGCAENCRGIDRCSLHRIQGKDTGDVIPVSKLQWGGRIDIRYPVNSITQLAIYLLRCIGKNKPLHNVYSPIME